MDKTYIEIAAKEHARTVLGEVSYGEDEEILENIQADFIAGVNWAIALQEEASIKYYKN